jgi:hypothetical protein
MEISDISKSLKLLLLEAHKKGFVSSKSQNVMSILSFYIATKELNKQGLIEVDGSYKGGEEKKWKLTKKGKEVIGLLIKLDKILRGEHER